MRKYKIVDKNEVVRMYLNGDSIADIAAANNCKPTYVMQILGKSGYYRRYPIDKGKIQALARAHWTMEEIAFDCHCTVEEVKACLS